MNNPTCPYCQGEFSISGITAHQRRCKHAKPDERQARIEHGHWRPRTRGRFLFEGPGGARQTLAQAVGSSKINMSA